MRFYLSASTCIVALTCFAGSASADEKWTHFYAGLYSAYTSVDNHLSPTNGYVFAISGVSGGLMLGYDKQFNNLVLGFEGDAGLSGVNGSGTNNSWTVNMGGLDLSARARAGFAMDNLLIYGTGGFASSNMNVNYPSGPILNQNRTGWQLGAGLEYALSEKLNLRGEYLYTDFGLSNGLIPSSSQQFQTTSSTFRLGLSYKF